MTQALSQTPDAHLLFWRMIEAMDIPLAEAIQKAELAPDRLSKMLIKCAHCPQPQYCALFLAARDSRTATPPHFCANRAAIRRLHALHRPGSDAAAAAH